MDQTTQFTPWMSLLGGVLIGLSAVLLMAVQGRIAGLTGIVAGVLPGADKDRDWRLVFLAASIVVPALLTGMGHAPTSTLASSIPLLVVSGLIVGIGVVFGGGCPSGHGVCGLSRLSIRSLVAVVTFMVFAAITVFLNRHVLGV